MNLRSICLAGWYSVAVLVTAMPATGQERRQVPEFRTYGEPESPDIAVAIDDLIRDFKDAWSTQDTDALKLHADDDVEWLANRSYGHHGRAVKTVGQARGSELEWGRPAKY